MTAPVVSPPTQAGKNETEASLSMRTTLCKRPPLAGCGKHDVSAAIGQGSGVPPNHMRGDSNTVGEGRSERREA
jgi:hypothetical protein